MRRILFAAWVTACGSAGPPEHQSDAGPAPPSTCGEQSETRYALGAELAPGQEATLCRARTLERPLSVTGFVGSLGPGGHHSLLFVFPAPIRDDGVAPCAEAELMDNRHTGDVVIVAGVAYETDGVAMRFPSEPAPLGFRVPAGAQVVMTTHFVNPTDRPLDGCSTLELEEGEVVVPVELWTLLPEAQYELAIPPGEVVEVSYRDSVPRRARLLAAMGHVHEGALWFRLRDQETGAVLVETAGHEPEPTIFDGEEAVVLDPGEELLLECGFHNPTPSTQRFPDQMCVGALYVVPCSFPGAC